MCICVKETIIILDCEMNEWSQLFTMSLSPDWCHRQFIGKKQRFDSNFERRFGIEYIKFGIRIQRSFLGLVSPIFARIKSEKIWLFERKRDRMLSWLFDVSVYNNNYVGVAKWIFIIIDYIKCIKYKTSIITTSTTATTICPRFTDEDDEAK